MRRSVNGLLPSNQNLQRRQQPRTDGYQALLQPEKLQTFQPFAPEVHRSEGSHRIFYPANYLGETASKLCVSAYTYKQLLQKSVLVSRMQHGKQNCSMHLLETTNTT
jgi:hypothetical protein